MKILVTGAAGFLGSRLAGALLAGAPGLPEVSTLVAVDIAAGRIDDPRVDWKIGTITDDQFTRSIVEPDVDAVYHLAAVVSGQAEAEFDLGMRVNVDAHTRAARGLPSPRETATLRLHELARRLRRRASRHRAGRRRGGAAIVVRLGESDRRAAGARVFEEGIRRRHRLPPAHGGGPSRSRPTRPHRRSSAASFASRLRASTRSARCRSTHASGSLHRSW